MLGLTGITQHEHSHLPNRVAVIPTARRLNPDSRYTGRGITIAVIDSGFYPHPDLTEPHNRILAFRDFTTDTRTLDGSSPTASDWHGTQTSVVAAGNGYLSDGVFRGLAPDACLVLCKVSADGRITDDAIVRALDWVIENRRTYGIRIVNLSLGADEDASFHESAVDAAAERAVESGLILVVAAGNSGCLSNPRPIPPANSPSVITVGGYDDNNDLDNSRLDLYCSNYGLTVDGVVKPEIIAPARWVAAPILPGTDFYRRAEALSQLADAPDYLVKELVERFADLTGLPDDIGRQSTREIRAQVQALLVESKITATHYQHVDGTSFAAPIVASVVAQMLEANPELTPQVTKQILTWTADRLPHQPLMRQGFGAVNVSRAVEEALREIHREQEDLLHPPRVDNDRLVFQLHDDTTKSVALAGDFNDWDPSRMMLEKQAGGLWRIAIKMLAPGTYAYKFVIDRRRWVADPGNLSLLPDGHGGFNSVLSIRTSKARGSEE